MPAQVVVVIQDSAVLDAVTQAIRANGHTVRPFADPLEALGALERAESVEVLITCISFPEGKGNGRSLALMARMKRRGVTCIFLARPGESDHVSDMGACLSMPVDPAEIAAISDRLLVGTRLFADGS